MRPRNSGRWLLLLLLGIAPEAVFRQIADPGPPAISTIPADGGSILRLDAPLHIRFSAPVRREDVSFAVRPEAGSWSAEWSEDRKRVALAHTQPLAPGTEYVLRIKLAPAKETPVEKTVHFRAFGPGSLELVDEAEKRGEIDLDRAWTYRLQAVFEPSVLPEAFQSATPTPCGTSVLLGLENVRSRLKPETAGRAARYLLRPTDPRSVFAGRVNTVRPPREAEPGSGPGPFSEGQRPAGTPAANGWFAVDSRLYPLTVWSAVSAAAADRAIALIESKTMYGRFKNLMPFEPESDADIGPDNGGDGRLDIYLVPSDPHLRFGSGFALGLTRALTGAPRAPCLILIREDLTGSSLGSVLAHELFHAFQFAVDQREPLWWLEATATWSMNFIEPRWDMERDFVDDAFEEASHRLQTLTSPEGLHPYGAYLFPYYLSSSFGDKVIGDLWTDCLASGPNALDAVERRLQGAGGSGFLEAWKQFALMNYDDVQPFGPTYPETLDVYPHHGEHKILLTTDHSGIGFDLPPLSAVYIDVLNYGIDKQKTPSVVFDLKALRELPRVGVQGVVMRGDRADVQDWTGLEEKLFCLNVPEQEFERIVVVVSSAEKESTHRALDIPILLGRDPRCDADWEGTLTFTRMRNQSRDDPGERRKTGRYQPRPGADWVDQFTTYGVKESCRISVSAVVRLALKAVGKGEADDGLAELNRLFADAAGMTTYTQEALDGSCLINYEHRLEETTVIEPSANPGKFVQTSTQRASSGSSLVPAGLTVLRAPRLVIDSKAGRYTLEVNFTFAQCRGESIVETNQGDRSVQPWDLENRDALFDSYPLRTQWNVPALGGAFKGDLIRGEWTSPPKRVPGDKVVCELFGRDGVKVSWELRRVKR